MAGASLFALLDDIATLLDDVTIMTKVAAKKTAGVLGDDLAVNAEKMTGLAAKRELKVVAKVAKGSALNKVILLPMALLLSFLALKFGAPWIVVVPLMIGGLYLCYEGAEKLLHSHTSEEHTDQLVEAALRSEEDLLAYESEKIKGAVRTDFVLSAEIMVIALGIVEGAALGKQALVLALIAILMTVGVYGLVAFIIKIDDIGLWLMEKRSAVAKKVGRFMFKATAPLMKTLSVVGTAAMFLVGGGILVHNSETLHHGLEAVEAVLGHNLLVSQGYNFVAGLLAGAVLVAVFTLAAKLKK